MKNKKFENQLVESESVLENFYELERLKELTNIKLNKNQGTK
mgnify:CR=1 FL=1